MWLRRLAFVLLGLSGACAGEGTLVVQVRTDLLPGRDFAAVTTRIAGTDERRRDATETRAWGVGVRVAEVALAPGRYAIRVAAIDGADRVAVERPVSVEVGSGVTVATVLLTRDCRGVVCPRPGGAPTADACLAGECVPGGCTEETPEACGIGACTPGGGCDAEPLGDCAEAECTSSGRCLAVPDHDACAADQVCDTERGCIATTPVCATLPPGVVAVDLAVPPGGTGTAGDPFGSIEAALASMTDGEIRVAWTSGPVRIPPVAIDGGVWTIRGGHEPCTWEPVRTARTHVEVDGPFAIDVGGGATASLFGLRVDNVSTPASFTAAVHVADAALAIGDSELQSPVLGVYAEGGSTVALGGVGITVMAVGPTAVTGVFAPGGSVTADQLFVFAGAEQAEGMWVGGSTTVTRSVVAVNATARTGVGITSQGDLTMGNSVVNVATGGAAPLAGVVLSPGARFVSYANRIAVLSPMGIGGGPGVTIDGGGPSASQILGSSIEVNNGAALRLTALTSGLDLRSCSLSGMPTASIDGAAVDFGELELGLWAGAGVVEANLALACDHGLAPEWELDPSSACVDAGIDPNPILGLDPPVTIDRAGNPRGPRWDIGPSEAR